MNQRFISSAVLSLFALGSLPGCGGEGTVGPGEGGAGGDRSFETPSPVEGSSLCVLSVDCPAGQHCDLGECVQDCNTEDPCTGELACSPRARCVEAVEEDRDQVDPSVNRGRVEVSPATARLLESDRELTIQLTSTSPDPVRYRVTSQTNSLSVREERGEFTGETSLVFDVDSSRAHGADEGGTIKIFTTLGEVAVPVVMKRGITGKYQGALRYSVNGVELGDARLGVEIIETNGDLSVLIDDATSLLFPDSGAGPATGVGTYDAESGGHFTVQQRIGSSLGGTRNRFGRDLGRRITFDMKRNSLGGFEGTFTERVVGLLSRPVTLEGKLFLSARPGAGVPDFEIGKDARLPTFEPPPLADFTQKFTQTKSCSSILTTIAGSDFDVTEVATQDKVRLSYGLAKTFQTRTSPPPATFADIRATCETEVLAAAKPSTVQCAWQPALVCATGYAAGAYSITNSPRAFQEFFVDALQPALLIAQEYMVKGLNDSLGLGGLAKERSAYRAAADRLDPVLGWALHPSMAGYLADLPLAEARGPEPTDDDDRTTTRTFPAARALARLLQVGATLDGERSRIDGIDVVSSEPALIETAQARALLGLYESAVVLEMTRGWGITPDLLDADLSGSLNPLDAGFGALLEGARAFGIPDGYIPFVWRPEDSGSGATNFEQMHALAAKSRSALASLEAAYRDNARTFEASESALLKEAHDISASYDSQIRGLCGAGFDPAQVEESEDFEACGADFGGEVGAALLAIQQADQRIAEGLARVRGMNDKLQISEDTLRRTRAARDQTLEFIDSTGEQISGLEMTARSLDLAIECISLSSQSGLLNFGGPAVGAGIIATVGIQKIAIEDMADDLRRAQDLALPQLDGKLELIEGMADLKRQTIDIVQAQMELASLALEKQQTELAANNLVSRAKELHALRRRAIAIAELDPSRDPSFRLLRDTLALQLLESRARLQKQLLLTGRALEYEVNTPIQSLPSAVLAARSSLGMEQLLACYEDIASSYRIAFGTPQKYSTEVSVREMLGITGERVDEATGQVLSPGEQFRLITQKNAHFDEEGGLTITFSTNLQPDNGLWSSDVCADRVATLQAQLVGDNLGDNEAQVNLDLTGAAVLRECDSDAFRVWSMSEGTSAGVARAVIQAGVNSYGTTSPNGSLFGQSVARASWRLTIPGPSAAPANSDVALEGLEDIVLKIEHQAVPRRETPLFVDLSCLGSIN